MIKRGKCFDQHEYAKLMKKLEAMGAMRIVGYMKFEKPTATLTRGQKIK